MKGYRPSKTIDAIPVDASLLDHTYRRKRAYARAVKAARCESCKVKLTQKFAQTTQRLCLLCRWDAGLMKAPGE